MKKKILTHLDWIIVVILFVVFGGIYSYMSVILHNHFQTFGWDLGFFDQIIWKASHGDLIAYSTLAKENLLADHFQVVLYLLTPLYWFMQDVRLILIAQALLVVSAIVPLFALSKKITNSKIFSLSIVVTYLLFLGTQWTILNEFHQTAFVPLFLGIFFYAISQKNLKLLWIGTIGLLCVKEEFSLLVAALGCLVFFLEGRKRLGIVLFVLGVSMFFFLVQLGMPFLSVRGTYHHLGFGEAGYTPTDVIKKSVSDPQFFLRQMVYPPIKIKTVFDSFLAFGFLPFLAPVYLIPVAEQFMTRFIYAGPQFTQWANVNHHAAPLGMLLSVGSVYAVTFLEQRIHKKLKWPKKRIVTIIGVYILFVAVAQDVVLHGPINSFFKPQFHETREWMRDNYEIIKKIPPGVSVSAQNSLLPHLSQREEIYLLPEVGEAQYVFVDLEDGPNKFSPLSKIEIEDFINDLIFTGEYIPVRQIGKAMLLQKSSEL